MIRLCPHPLCARPTNVIRDGKFQRKEDSKFIQRFRCKTCGHRFSHATFSLAYRQKKRRINSELRSLLASGMSMRRSAVVLKINRKTVDKKLKYLGELARRNNQKELRKRKG